MSSICPRNASPIPHGLLPPLPSRNFVYLEAVYPRTVTFCVKSRGCCTLSFLSYPTYSVLFGLAVPSRTTATVLHHQWSMFRHGL